MTFSGDGQGAGTSDSTSSSLLRRVKDQQPDAWRSLIQLYGPLVYVWGRQSGLQAADATDLVQDVFAAVFRNISEYRRDRPEDSFRGWLWTIARNKIRDHFRKHRDRPVAQGGTTAQELMANLPEAPPETSSPGFPLDDRTSLVHRALTSVQAEFTQQTWQAFWQTTVDGRPPALVADELGTTVQAVYTAKSRVLRRIRRELEELGE